ncbi:hypothetical protein [Ancylomarina sp.]|uniref:hypothetical protein n=1 Tax=Ancylomarina sp. TaxID=1970196 RepID=UPI003563AC9E
MRTMITLISLFLLFAFASIAQQPAELYTKISLDELIENAEQYENKKVELIGLVVHICGVDGKKMKLKSPSGAIVKIVPNDSNESYDSALKKQVVSVQGVVEISRIEKAEIDKVEKEKTLLCHIDNTPCKDKEWVNNKIESGADVTIVKKDIAKLRKQMETSGKDYVTCICIRAEHVAILN